MKLQKRERKQQSGSISTKLRKTPQTTQSLPEVGHSSLHLYPARSYPSKSAPTFQKQRPDIITVGPPTPTLRTKPPQTLSRSRPGAQTETAVLPSIVLMPSPGENSGQSVTLFKDPAKRSQCDDTIDLVTVFSLTLHRFGKFPLRPIISYDFPEEVQPFYIASAEEPEVKKTGTNGDDAKATGVRQDGKRAAVSFTRHSSCENPQAASESIVMMKLCNHKVYGSSKASGANTENKQAPQSRTPPQSIVYNGEDHRRHSQTCARDASYVEQAVTSATWSPEDFASTIRSVKQVHFPPVRRKSSPIQLLKEAYHRRRYSMDL
ncbi:hypothetical protein BDV96DRAFT_642079 [Lophiotrema nucula]|uniref:Uncharacterized protein n=1 Tax=Lophiotrema nucula TaxID=690887 RepID=A0A6A5ZMY6_9PLEO|nr:hypothetical protein BDV96DRAFT_642079 [Lophiotrema nucula]